jgi:arylsulfatase A-like enzyme
MACGGRARRLGPALAVLGWLVGGTGCSGGSTPLAVVLIVADDLGWADLGVQGGREIRTPELDALARSGLRFEQAYATAPICAPSRAALLTGRDQNRYGYTSIVATFGYQMQNDLGVPTDEILLPEPLRAAGFATGAFGKWHLGARPKYRPRERGFDTFFGHLDGAHDYFDWSRARGYGPIFQDDEPVEGDEYLTRAITRRAVDFIRQHRGDPFFLYVAYNAVHAPWQAPEAAIAAYAAIEDPQRRVVAAMLSVMDEGVGAIRTALDAAGRAENALVIFLSDNGGGPFVSDNGPLRGEKGSLLEGGIRVPFFVSWPERIAAGGVYPEPVTALDVFPTVLAAAGAAPPADRPLDGVDLLPYLDGERSGAPHPVLTWRWHAQMAIRRGSWKLVRHLARDERDELGLVTELFDLSSDVGETRDHSAGRAELVAELEREFNRWADQMGPATTAHDLEMELGEAPGRF